MSATKNQAKPAHRGLSLQIPIFYKLMVSMLFVSMIPMMLLGIVSMGGTDSIVTSLGLTNSIFVLTFVTLSVVVMWSFFLASSITNPIVKLSEIATSMSTGELKNPEIELLGLFHDLMLQRYYALTGREHPCSRKS